MKMMPGHWSQIKIFYILFKIKAFYNVLFMGHVYNWTLIDMNAIELRRITRKSKTIQDMKNTDILQWVVTINIEWCHYFKVYILQ